ncbi:MAG: aminotransferase class I/II-fold pyridoxal phosphate-dependent enzyme [Candidatus Thorarchaeota archaeon]
MNFDIIKKTPLYSAFSKVGKRVFLPQGIFYWADRAKNEAELIGTIGEAYAFEHDFIDESSSNWVPCYLEGVKDYLKNLAIDDLVPYSSIPGIKQLRQVWKDWIIEKSLYNKNNQQEQLNKLINYITMPLITSGVTNGIFLSCSLFLNPEEKIIAPNKRWGNYDNIVEKYLGAKIKPFEFFKEQKFNLHSFSDAIDDVAKTQEKITAIVNFPNNPTGYMPLEDETRDIIDLLVEKQNNLNIPIIVIVDDAYEPYVFTESPRNKSIFYSLQQLDEDIIPVKLDGVTKELLIYGARIGFLTIGLKPSWTKTQEELNKLNQEVDNILSGFNRIIISNSNHFYQSLVLKLFKEQGITNILKMRDKVYNLLKTRYLLINQELSKIEDPNISIDPNSGGFFVFVNLNPDKIKANEFADFLLKKYRLGVIPIEKPQEQVNGIRIAYCSIDLKNIPEFIKRIKLALKEF